VSAASRPALQSLTMPALRPRPSNDDAQSDAKRPRLASADDLYAGVPPASDMFCKRAVSSKASATSANGVRKSCDRCDAKTHTTDECPHFNKVREDHKDAWLNYGKKGPLSMGGDGGNKVLCPTDAKMVRQPGDGSCLFHSLRHGLVSSNLYKPVDASQLRRAIADFILKNPRLEIAGDTLEEWVRWDQDISCDAYAKRMAQAGWGGGIEMAACSHLLKVNVHVYEQQQGGRFRRISRFDYSAAAEKRTVNVLYRGRMHFDALVMLQGR